MSPGYTSGYSLKRLADNLRHIARGRTNYDVTAILVAARELEAVEAKERLITNLKAELRDALQMQYGHPMNWPQQAVAALGVTA